MGMHSRFVGRQREFALLWGQHNEATQARVRFAMLSGEPGIGKTRLLRELARRTAGEGAIVLRGGASEAEGMPPYLPFLEALGSHIKSASAASLREQVGASASILATILPELRLRLDDPPPDYPLPPEQARLRLFEAVSDFFRAIAADAPLVLVLDDLHWADFSQS